MSRFGANWWIVLVAIVALALSQPLLIFMIWRLHISPAQVTLGNEFGALMGAVFTAGGLVVAIVSIYTMASIARVSRDAVKPLFRDIPAQINEQIRRFSEAYDFYLKAQRADRAPGRSLDNLRAVEGYVKKALALESSISGIYAWIGSVYYTTAALMYRRLVMPRSAEGTTNLPARDHMPAISEKACSWLKEARRRTDGDQREVAAEIAELHGLMHATLEDALTYINAANSDGEPLLPSGSASLAMLFGLCRNGSEVATLSDVLNLDAPLSATQIKELLAQHIAIPNMQYPLPLLAVTNPYFTDPKGPASPGMVNIRWIRDGSEAYADWIRRVQTSGMLISDGIPAFGPIDSVTGYPATPAPIPIDDLLERVLERFFIISRLDWNSFPERQP